MSLYDTARREYLTLRGFLRYRQRNKDYSSIKLMSPIETLEAVKRGKSLVRFGDGEMAIIIGKSIWFQSHDEKLGRELESILKNDDKNLVVAVLPVIKNMKSYCRKTRRFWYRELLGTRAEWRKHLSRKIEYGDSFVTRARTDLKQKYQRPIFEKWRDIFNNRDIVIIEGQTTCMGVGDDLFEKAKSVRRIIGPSKNAYSKIAEIERAFKAQKIKKDTLVLICLGPAAKQLTVNLHNSGYQTVDAGHLGQEYALYCNNAHRTGEDDNRFDGKKDANYKKQIIAEIK